MAVAREPAPPGASAADTERRRPPSDCRRRRLPAPFAFALLFNNYTQAVMLTLPFTLATYMVRDWLRASSSSAANPVDERRVGELTGVLTAAYSLAQAATGVPFGRWSDAHGRRPVLLLGAAASAVSVALFGLAGSLGPAMIARAGGGALNAFIGAWKTALAEAAAGDEHEQARVMSLMGLAWGVGCVLGPGLGGLLARPCDRASLRAAFAPFGLCGGGGGVGGGGGGGLFDARPYSLPCLVVALVCAASGVLTWFWVPETLGLGEDGLLLPVEEGAEEHGSAATTATAAAGRGADEEQATGGAVLPPPKSDRSPLLPQPSARDALCVVVTTEDAAGKAATAATAAAAASCQRRPRSSAGGRGSLELQPAPSFSKFKRLPYTGGGEADGEPENDNGKDDGDDDALLLPPAAAAGAQPPPPPPPPAAAPNPLAPPPAADRPPWHRCPYVRHALVGYTLICLHFIALEELVPLWASSPFSSGGLARAPAQLALPLALNGLSLVLCAALFYPPLRARLGTVPLLRYGAVLGACVAALMPLPSLLVLPMAGAAAAETQMQTQTQGQEQASAPPSAASPLSSPPLPPHALALWLALMGVKAGAQAAAFTGAMIRVNVAGRRAGGLGSINGVGQTLASLARGLGPAAAGASWAAAVWLRLVAPPLLPTQFAPFLAVAAVAAVIYWWYGKAEAEDAE